MSDYIAPSSDYRFLAGHVLAPEYLQMPGAADADAATLSEIVATLGTFVAERLVPLSVLADEEGCTVADGSVRTPRGYPEVYKELAAAGWASLHVAPEHGGQGLPLAAGLACDEVLSSGSMSFALYASLRLGVYKVIDALGSDVLKSDYLSRIGSGEWNGTMCLTEPQCGTDLSLMRTTASDTGDGTYRISGTKIFITGGDHDLTENIAHLVLARVQGGASGLAGLGLFIVPKFRKNASGAWTVPNGVRCPRVEHKLGIHASATAELLFEDAHGWIVGTPGTGLAGMFIMMKLARLGTSFQAIGVAEIASQKALAYARERVQGRDLVGGRKGSVPIIEHPNIRRELVRMRTLTSSARMLAFFASITQETTASPDPALAVQSERLLSMLMPLSKVVASEYGVEVATAAMQTLGGHGYIRESGVEVLLRDVQILPIYEGTNDVQSLDIVLRRLEEGCPELLAWMRGQVAFLPQGRRAAQVSRTLDLIEGAAVALAGQLKASPFSALEMAREFLWLVGHGVMGVLWLRTLQTIDQGDKLPINAQSKRAEADFYFAFVHPEVDVRAARLNAASEVQDALLAHELDFI
ncbi:acyl-CoA dehydrogenase family protein [Noviherbaspirillum saxi]|uniref:Acyl-CoA dehydrogenase n=1 Tax=Noviherbaspirillum saxi TaxID=2320863 RepID=A0A3A3FWR5_9BURK|nr:acyl-CoA dehydrogenase family protein [Noviherbaspirillum saxi]RJF99784.1 acyl-CoA dehydrogenase [Noviherbaspirillum saxi]